MKYLLNILFAGFLASSCSAVIEVIASLKRFLEYDQPDVNDNNFEQFHVSGCGDTSA
ncbi:MAG: hypothetical protein LAT57_03535 [Balneolales bacterium]|nr:hypothetical protein [Balneolales bacterium]